VRYNRVSDDNRKLSRSVPEQEAEGLAVVIRNGWTDGGSYADNDMSASRFATKVRPAWADLADDVLPSGKVQILILWEPSRGARLLSTWALLLETCQRLGILVHITSHDETYDLSKPRHWKTLADDGVKAVYDSEETSQRVRRGLAGHAASGKPTGHVLYGYRRHYDPETREFVEQVIDEEKAAVVRECADWIASKKPVLALVTHLHEKGVRAPRGGEWWSPFALKSMVLNPGYLGKRVHQGTVVSDGVWPAILTETQHYDCRDVLKAEGRTREHDGKVKHLLSGLAACDTCTGELRPAKSSGWPCYTCRKKCVTIREADFDEYVLEVMFARLERDDFADLLQTNQRSGDAEAAEEEAGRLRAALEGFYQQAAPTVPEADRLSPLGLARAEREYKPLIAAAETRAKTLRVPSVLRNLAGPGIRQRWSRMEMSQQREVIRTVIAVRVLPIGRGRQVPPEDRVVVDWLQS